MSYLEVRLPRFFILRLGRGEALNPKTSNFGHYSEELGQWGTDCPRSQCFRGCHQSSNRPSQGPPCLPRARAFPSPPLNQLGQPPLQFGTKTISIPIKAGATLSVLHPTVVKQPLPRSNKTVQIVGILYKQVHVSEPIHFCLFPLRDTYCSLLFPLLLPIC